MVKISKEEFEKAIQRVKEFKKEMNQFEDKEECIAYLMNASHLSKEECMKAYEFYSKLDVSDERIQLAKASL